ncbi:MAG: glutamate 5-kinase [Coriobacteriales bacterium]|jgi:glutamate 5-kinase|nr:glutamate 5-kinase [Coriobacteriales bacterium]
MKTNDGEQRAPVNRLVVKIGSSTLTTEDGRFDSSYLQELARQVALLRKGGTEVLIVSSAAIVAGLQRLNMPSARPEDIPTLQAAAAVGQIELTQSYREAFAVENLQLGQILITRNDTTNRESYLHARDTLERLLELGIIPLINENDTIAIDEIRFGDNDTLAAQVAILVKADLVVLLSDIEGLYSADPRTSEDAELLQIVEEFSHEIVGAAGSAGSDKGSGGMFTKIEAARMLMAASIPMVICEGHGEDAILNAAQGKVQGTRFERDNQGKQANARKLWLALSGAVCGEVTIDRGAVTALRKQGSSLLPVGVVSSQGSFEKGNVVDIRDEEGLLIGRGISNYSSGDLSEVAGQRSSALVNSVSLENNAKTEVVHRDAMVIF